MFYSDWRQKLFYQTSAARQLMTKFVKRYRAGRPVIYDDNAPIIEPPTEFGSIEPEIYEGQMPGPPDYEPVQYDFLPEFHTPDLKLEPPQFPQLEVNNLEDQVLTAQQEIQD